jgi:hypothetical protein
MILITVASADASATKAIGVTADASGVHVLVSRFDEAKFDQADYE